MLKLFRRRETLSKNLIATTKSGSRYHFVKAEDGTIRVTNNYVREYVMDKECGLLSKVEIGKPLEFTAKSVGMYMDTVGEIMTFRSSPLVAVEWY